MSIQEVNTYEDLDIYINKEMARMVAEKVPVELRLNDKWFEKLAKLVTFSLKYTETKSNANKRLAKDCKRFAVKINGTGVIVLRN